MEVEANGRTFTVPDGSTDAQIGEVVDHYFSENPQESAAPVESELPPVLEEKPVADELPEGGLMDAVAEPALAVATSLGGGAISGTNAMYQMAEDAIGDLYHGRNIDVSESIAESDEFIDSVNSSVAEYNQPRTKMGEKGIETLGEVAEFGIDLARYPLSWMAGLGELLSGQSKEQASETLKNVQDNGFKQTIGDRVLGETNSPVAATAAFILPELLGAFLPINQIVKGSGRVRKQQDQELMTRILKNEGDNDIARYMVDGSGKIRTDKSIKPLVKAGFDQGVLGVYKGSSAPNKAKLVEMIDIRLNGLNNSVYRDKNRASQVAGDSLLERINYVNGVKRDAGKRIDDVANSLKGKPVDFEQPMTDFVADLKGIGVTLDNKLNPVFDKRSAIKASPAAQKLVKDMMEYFRTWRVGEVPDANDVHKLKRFIDETVTYGKNKEGLAGQSERIVKDLRHDIDAVLDGKFPEYDAVNTAYSESIDALNNIQKASGTTMDFGGRHANKVLGTVLRGLTSNIRSRGKLMEATENIEAIANKYGGGFDDSIYIQMRMSNDLDNILGDTADTGLENIIMRAGRNAAGNESVKSKALNTVKSGIDKITNKTDKEILEELKAMIQREPSRWEQ